jgi:hypothetical protein
MAVHNVLLIEQFFRQQIKHVSAQVALLTMILRYGALVIFLL